jgi:hypothetical protein
MTGLIGWWPLHENSGSTARDLSGNGNPGTLNGGVTQGVAGKGGLTAYSFDGMDGEVNAGNINSFGNHDWTTSLWIKVNSIPDKIQHILHWGDGDFTIWWLIHLKDLSGDGNYDDLTVHFDEGENKNTIDIIDSNVDDGKYHHLTIVHKESDKYELYVDGELSGTTPDTDTLRDSGNNSLYFAGDPTGNNRYFNGTINDIRTYNRALSPEEIQTLYEWGSGDYTKRSYHDGSDSGAVSRWKFDGDVNDSWSSNDASRNGPNFSSNSVRSQSLRFDGSGDTMNGSLGSYSEFTASLWINIEDDSNDSYPLWGDKNDGTSSSYEAPMIRINNGSLKFFGRADLNYSEYYTQNWAHIVYTASPEKDYYFFNGKIVETASTSGTVDWNNLNFGNRPGQSSYFKGKIDDFRIYNRALQPNEVFQLYQWGTRGRDMRKLTTNARGDQ